MKNYVDIPVWGYGTKRIVDPDPVDWAKENCPSYITCGSVKISGEYYYRFYFSDGRDQALFVLKWA